MNYEAKKHNHKKYPMKHLGGHEFITHVDGGSLKFLKEHKAIRSVIDVGCGVFDQVLKARELGLEGMGIDGDPAANREDDGFLLHDFTTGPPSINKKFDLAWSCEFVEHVEERFVGNFMFVFKLCKYVLITHALPGQDGYHHVNCQSAPYWINKFESEGFKYNEDLTVLIRQSSTMEREFIRNNGLFFENQHPDFGQVKFRPGKKRDI